MLSALIVLLLCTQISGTRLPVWSVPFKLHASPHAARYDFRALERPAAAVEHPAAARAQQPERVIGQEPTLLSAGLQFIGDVELGTPPQKLRVEFSTSVRNFWVVGVECEAEECLHTSFYAYNRTRFNKTASASFLEPNSSAVFSPATDWFDPNYGNGTNGTDTLRLASGVIVPRIWVGVLYSLSEEYKFYSVMNSFRYHQADGIFGLRAPRQWKAPRVSVSPLEQLLEQVAQPLFTIWLESHQYTHHEGAGMITFGSLDHVNCAANWTFSKCSPDAHNWFLSNVTATYGELTDSSLGVHFWSEFEMIAGPHDFIVAIAKKVNATFSAPAEFLVDCKSVHKLPSLDFEIGGYNYSVPANNYVHKLAGGSCKLALMPIPSQWLFGAPFYRTYCVAHDVGLQRMGFSKSLQSFSNGHGHHGNGAAGLLAAQWPSLLLMVLVSYLISK